MRDIFITSSILILAILLIRFLVKGKINPCIQYALWLLVVIRLVLPVPLWNSRFSIMNLFPAVLSDGVTEVGEYNRSDVLTGESDYNQFDMATEASEYNRSDVVTGGNEHNQSGAAAGASEYNQSSMAAGGSVYTHSGTVYALNKVYMYIGKLLPFIWIAGILITGGYMLFYQRKWKRYLNENRIPLDGLDGMEKYRGNLSVYTVEGLPSPCLSGRSIYLTDKMAENKEELEHILAHEYCHYRQLDSIWVTVRCILTIIYWFNPLVWAAAYISKQDSELACDEAAIRMLGEKERISYGKTLIRLVSDDVQDLCRIGIVSTMSGGEKGIKERISLIAKKPKYFVPAAVVVLAAAAVLAAVTFSGAGEKDERLTASEDKQISEENKTSEDHLEGNSDTVLSMQDNDALNGEALAAGGDDKTIDSGEENMEEPESELINDEMTAQHDSVSQEKLELESIKQELEAEYEAIKAEYEKVKAEYETIKSEGLQEAEPQLVKMQEDIKAKEQELEKQLSVLEKKAKAKEQLLTYTNPCPEYTRISDTFGERIHPLTGETRMHNGIDLAAAEGADIVAAAEGYVHLTGFDAERGNYIVLYHALNGEYTYYENCGEVLAKQGEEVTQGQKIATIGISGRSTGSHLHFALSRNGEYVEPVIDGVYGM